MRLYMIPVIIFFILYTTCLSEDKNNGTILEKAFVASRIALINNVKSIQSDKVKSFLKDGKYGIINSFIEDPVSFLNAKKIATIPNLNTLMDFYKTYSDSLIKIEKIGIKNASELNPESNIQWQASDDFGQPKTKSDIGFGSLAWQTEVLTGLADFLIERAKDEVVLTLPEKMKDLINDENDSLFLALLAPKTKNLLNNLESVSVKTILPNLKAAVTNDMQNLATNFLCLLDTLQQTYRHLMTKDTTITKTLPLVKIVLNQFNEIMNGTDPLFSLSRMNEDDLDTLKTGSYKTIGKYLNLIRVVSYEVYNGTEIHMLNRDVNIASFLKDVNNREFFLVYLIKELNDKEVIDAEQLDKINIKNNYTALMNFVDEANNLKKMVKNIRAVSEDSSKSDLAKLTAYTQAFNNILVSFKYFDLGYKVDMQKLNTVTTILTGLSEIERSISSADYSAAITLSMDMLINTFGAKIPEKIIRITSFSANLAGAKSSDAVKEAIETFVDPVGSFRAKRTEGWFFTLNSYMGGFGGWERIVDNPYNSGGVLLEKTVGLSAMVGLDLGGSIDFLVINSISLFVPLIDLGNFISYRLGKSEVTDSVDVSTIPQFGFKQVFAPGAFFMFGISKDMPVSIGIGAQFLPELRKFEGTDEETISSWRYGFFLGLDLSLFRF